MSHRRSSSVGAAMVAAALVLVLGAAPACKRPDDTVRVHPGSAAAGPPVANGRAPAPRMSVKDHTGRELTVPVPGQVTVLSFASRSTADRGSALCRAVRVAHPEVTILEMMDVSSAPSFMASKVASKLAERHQTIVTETERAFAAAQRTPPADLDGRIHIVADWSAAAFRAYGASNADDEVQIAVIDGAGGLVTFFATTPTEADLTAAVARAAGPI